MAKAKQLPSGQWRALVYSGKDANGKRQYKSFTESTERKANLAALEWQEHYKEVTKDGSSMTVDEAIEEHIQAHSNIFSPATIAGYRRSKKRLVNLGSIKLNKLTEKRIRDEVNIHAGKYSAKTIYNDFGLLKTILKVYRPDFRYTVDMPVVYPTITEVPLDEDLRKIYALAYGTELEIPLLLACWLGMRVSETRGLKREKSKNERIIIDSVVVQGEDAEGNKGAFEKDPKSKKSKRILELPPYINARMDVMIKDDREYITNLSGQAIYKRFVRMCDKAGVNHYRFHDLRHTNATVMLEENVPDKYIAERGGWGSDIYKKRYEHTTISKHKSVNEQLNTRFESIFNTDMQHEIQHSNISNEE